MLGKFEEKKRTMCWIIFFLNGVCVGKFGNVGCSNILTSPHDLETNFLGTFGCKLNKLMLFSRTILNGSFILIK